MRKKMRTGIALGACLVLLSSCAATAEELVGEAQGYGGLLRVSVTMDGDRIAGVNVTEHQETEGVGTRAIDALPAAIVAANSTEVDGVSGATVTSNAIKAAVQNALGQHQTNDVANPAQNGTEGGNTSSALPEGARRGIGISATGRIGPGSDDQGIPVYSFNVVMASGTFDAQGRILDMLVDQLEVATPNYDGSSMPEFSGWPGQGGYAKWDDAQGKTEGLTGDGEDDFMQEMTTWTTKRQRGEDYMLTSGSWQKQMDTYQRFFVGKTVDELEDWFDRCFSSETGRPLREGAGSEDDQTKYGALSDEDKTVLADVTSGATISLRDNHGDILAAIRRAWENASGQATQLTN